MSWVWRNGWIVAAAAALLATGCQDPPATVEFQYFDSPQYSVLTSARRVEVGTFRCEHDARWARLAEQALADGLGRDNFGGRAGEVRIVGDVHCTAYPNADPNGRIPTDAATARAGQGIVTIRFQIVEAASGELLEEMTITEQGSWHPGSPVATSAGPLRRHLVAACVRSYLDRVLPRPVVVRAELPRDDAETVQQANHIAAAGRYEEALDLYLRALREDPANHEVMYAVGLMYEAMGEMRSAASYYNAANQVRPDNRYAAAHSRAEARVAPAFE